MNIESLPNKVNSCAGAYNDWLEVHLTNECNGNCVWCIDKEAFHPLETATTSTLVKKILETGKQNIILLGGEPTLYKDIMNLVKVLSIIDKSVYITTNGSKLINVIDYADSLTGLNISIHHYDLSLNKEITGINLDGEKLLCDLKNIIIKGVKVRLNCNLIENYIDNKEKIYKYIEFAKSLGCVAIRFAELRDCQELFVDLNKIFNNQFGLNDDPFLFGCCQNAIINDMPISFRQMCGLQTTCRRKPINPKQYKKDVLYNNGEIYEGWQSADKSYTSGCCY
jgi:organic radical activating enzyme